MSTRIEKVINCVDASSVILTVLGLIHVFSATQNPDLRSNYPLAMNEAITAGIMLLSGRIIDFLTQP